MHCPVFTSHNLADRSSEPAYKNKKNPHTSSKATKIKNHCVTSRNLQRRALYLYTAGHCGSTAHTRGRCVPLAPMSQRLCQSEAGAGVDWHARTHPSSDGHPGAHRCPVCSRPALGKLPTTLGYNHSRPDINQQRNK